MTNVINGIDFNGIIAEAEEIVNEEDPIISFGRLVTGRIEEQGISRETIIIRLMEKTGKIRKNVRDILRRIEKGARNRQGTPHYPLAVILELIKILQIKKSECPAEVLRVRKPGPNNKGRYNPREIAAFGDALYARIVAQGLSITRVCVAAGLANSGVLIKLRKGIPCSKQSAISLCAAARYFGPVPEWIRNNDWQYPASQPRDLLAARCEEYHAMLMELQTLPGLISAFKMVLSEEKRLISGDRQYEAKNTLILKFLTGLIKMLNTAHKVLQAFKHRKDPEGMPR